MTDPGLAPGGCSTLYVLVPVTHQHANVDWTNEAPRFRGLALRQLAKIGLRRRRVADPIRANGDARRTGT